MPTSPSQTFTNDRLMNFYSDVPHQQQAVRLKPSTVFAKATILGEIGTTGVFAAYASGNADGTETPKCILDRACATDASGNITFGATATGGYNGETHPTAPAFFNGSFRTTELVGFDANAATKLGGHLVSGSIADGVYTF